MIVWVEGRVLLEVVEKQTSVPITHARNKGSAVWDEHWRCHMTRALSPQEWPSVALTLKAVVFQPFDHMFQQKQSGNNRCLLIDYIYYIYITVILSSMRCWTYTEIS